MKYNRIAEDKAQLQNFANAIPACFLNELKYENEVELTESQKTGKWCVIHAANGNDNVIDGHVRCSIDGSTDEQGIFLEGVSTSYVQVICSTTYNAGEAGSGSIDSYYLGQDNYGTFIEMVDRNGDCPMITVLSVADHGFMPTVYVIIQQFIEL